MSKYTQRGAELLESVEAHAEAILVPRLRKAGLSQAQALAMAKDSGRDLADELRMAWAGQLVYVPMDKSRRNARIFEQFTGNNHHELAERYHLGVPTIYDILRAESLRRRQKQGSLLEVA